MNFFEILYAQKNGVALPANFFDLLFAKSFTPATEWGEYDGTLPAQFNANGSMLADYRIYGAAGGVGDDSGTAYGYEVDVSVESVNKFDPAAYTVTGFYLTSVGGYYSAAPFRISGYIPVVAGGTYLLTSIVGQYPAYGWYNTNKEFISGARYMVTQGFADRLLTAPQNAAFLRFSYVFDTSSGSYNEDKCMVVDGSTAPPYQPYYNTTTKIYIGEQLEADEYVSFKEKKIYRRTENLWNGVYEQGGIDFMTGATFASANYVRTERMQCGGMTDIAFTYFAEAEQGAIVFYDGNGDYIREGSTMVISGGDPTFEYHHSVPSGAAYVAISFSAADSSQPISPATAAQVTVVEGSTAPSTYIPYLQPEDPPVPLPALPTVDGVTITDYAGQSGKPSRFYAKYQKG